MLYWILIIYLIAGYFFPIMGWAALICMIAPVWMSAYRGRYWCGHFCPRGNFYEKVLVPLSRGRRIPKFLRSVPFRVFMVMLIFVMFGVQMYFAWGDLSAMGKVFWNIVFVTTLVAIVLGILYAPRAWCTFCPMGSLSALVAPRKAKKGFKNIHVADSCVGCKLCARACPMQLVPYACKGESEGMMDADCIKCGKCVERCGKKAMELKEKV